MLEISKDNLYVDIKGLKGSRYAWLFHQKYAVYTVCEPIIEHGYMYKKNSAQMHVHFKSSYLNKNSLFTQQYTSVETITCISIYLFNPHHIIICHGTNQWRTSIKNVSSTGSGSNAV